jgi:hypothetical protein
MPSARGGWPKSAYSYTIHSRRTGQTRPSLQAGASSFIVRERLGGDSLVDEPKLTFFCLMADGWAKLLFNQSTVL